MQLKRFDYDMELDNMVKVNDRLEFPDHINLVCFKKRPVARRRVSWQSCKMALRRMLCYGDSRACGLLLCAKW